MTILAKATSEARRLVATRIGRLDDLASMVEQALIEAYQAGFKYGREDALNRPLRGDPLERDLDVRS